MSSPDEGAQLIRAVSAAEGQWRGMPSARSTVDNIATANTRSFILPAHLAVRDKVAPCFAFHPNTPASCSPRFLLGGTKESSYVGTYYPLLYIPLGVAARIAGNVPSAIYAARVVSALICALFLLMSFAFTCTSSWSRAAWFFAAGPLTLYVASSAATNGIEVAASICFVCVGLEISRRTPSTWLWITWVAAGIALTSAKSLGPLFLVFDLAAVILLTRTWSRWRSQLRKVPFAIGLIAAAAIANLAWSVSFQRSPRTSPTTSYFHYIHEVLSKVLHGAQGLFSQFGWLDTPTPAHLWVIGYLVALIIIGASLVTVESSARIKFLAVTVFAGLVTLWVTVTEIAGGFGFQARYTLAILAPLPILAVAMRSPDSVRRALPRLCIALMIILNAGALYGNARRYAVGVNGSLFFLHDAKWIPPGGWLVVGLLAIAGLGSLGVAGFLDPQLRAKSGRSTPTGRMTVGHTR